jgi:glycosyltransferase involved in cell wall biosynthesis
VRKPAARFDQLLPNFSYGDAIGNHVLALRGIFAKKGYGSAVYAQMRHPKLRGEARDYGDYLLVDGPGNTCLYHYSIGSPLSGFFASLKSRRVLVYHNITPHEYLEGVNRRAEFECRRGREELRRLAGSVDFALADSEYNRLELEEMGFEHTAVLPIVVDFAAYDRAPLKKDLEGELADGRTNILHVSRFVPNKKIEDVIKAFAVYKKINPRSRLLLAGTDVSFENYSEALRGLVAKLGVADVVFTGHVDFPSLCTLYRSAHLYLLMSEHEGFCVPLLEAMHFGVPIVAYAAAAVPGTLGDGGLLVKEKKYDEIAELVDYVMTEKGVAESLVEAGRRRLGDFAPEKIEGQLWDVLKRG